MAAPGSATALIPWCYAGYAVASVGIRRLSAGWPRDASFAALNLTGVYFTTFALVDPRRALVFWAYLGAVCGCYALTRLVAARAGWSPWLAFFAPLVLLAAVRWFPIGLASFFSSALAKKLAREPDFSIAPYFVGLSYLAFRCSRLVIEVRNGIAPMPSFLRYLGFAFFLPVMLVGPIHSWKQHAQDLDGRSESAPVGRCLARIAVGLAKYLFLAALFNQLGYSQLMLDGRLHGWPDLLVAGVSYYLFLYLNFSGYCDVAVGLGGLAGISVPENFNAPFAARNIRDFWNRWHITLSEYMRDFAFAPLSKQLVALFGPARAKHAIAATILVVFLTIGIWHGTGWNYAAFGLFHAVGVVANHYWGLLLKRRLSQEAWRAYHANRWISWAGTATTFCYVAASLFLFANSPTEMRDIFHILR